MHAMSVNDNVAISENSVVTVNQSDSKITIVNGEICGAMAGQIGTGGNAQQAIIYTIIKYVFIVGSVLSILVVINYWLFRENEKVPDFIGDLRMVWELFLPLITLSLGYLFGRAKKNKK